MIVLLWIKNNWKLVAAIIFFIATLVLGLILGKSMADNRQLKKDKKVYQLEIKDLNHKLDSVNRIAAQKEKEAAEHRDNSQELADKADQSEKKSLDLKIKTNKILNDTKDQMSAIDNLSRDSAEREFARRAEEYIRNTR